MSKPPRKPKDVIPVHAHLPETIKLKESQRVALTGLANQEAAILAQGQRALNDVYKEREKVLAEIETEHGLEAGTLAKSYQLSGDELVKAGK